MAEPLGEIKISEDVESSIAGYCALKTPGVAGMAGMTSSLREGIGRTSRTSLTFRAVGPDEEYANRVRREIAGEVRATIPSVFNHLSIGLSESAPPLPPPAIWRVR